MIDHISNGPELRQNYTAAQGIFNSLLGVWKSGQTRSFVFDILLEGNESNFIIIKKTFSQFLTL